MGTKDFVIRGCRPEDSAGVIELWQACGLIMPWNNPDADIERKLRDSPELFYVGDLNGKLIAGCMAGYDGHRGWIYYLAVDPAHRRRGYAAKLVRHAESQLLALGCPKIDLMVRDSNSEIQSFYRNIGYSADPVVVLSKRLIEDDRHDYCDEGSRDLR